ncbi:hypothetical protein [Aureispira sp. CCB-QB1]|uniref:hypothetical protein n=1 Tax=Aureispira sp. CCB-QB1 TaxID=1313421 RepID=UPI0006964EC1|nr:hypothetical protein [Aureispira sp. CCB-QB1]
MNQEVIRIYTPISADLCIATPHAKVKGKNSYAPLPEGSAEIELISDVEEMGGIVDPNYSLIANRKGHSEEGEVSLTIFLPDTDGNPAKTEVLIGVDKDSLPIFGVATAVDSRLEIGGTFGDKTLSVLAGLARRGTGLRINGIHVDADDDKHFASRIIERQYSHDGNNAGDKPHIYPKSDSKDQQTTIRTLTGMNVYLDGFAFLKMPVYKGIAVNMTIQTTYLK